MAIKFVLDPKWLNDRESIIESYTYGNGKRNFVLGVYAYSTTSTINQEFYGKLTVTLGGKSFSVPADDAWTDTIPYSANGERTVLVTHVDVNIPISGITSLKIDVLWETNRGNVSGSDTISVTPMVVPSTITLNKNPATWGETLGITINQSANTNMARHVITAHYKQDDWEVILDTDSPSRSVNWVIDKEYAKYFTGATMTMPIKVHTFDHRYDDVNAGEPKAVNLKLNSSSDMKPTVNLTLVDTQTAVYNKFGGYVKGKSKIKATVATTLKYSAKLTSGSLKMNNETFNVTKTSQSFTTANFLKTAGSNTVTATVTDSRNNTTTKSEYVNVINYYNPTVSMFAIRCDVNGNEDDQGAYCKITYTVNISSSNDRNDKEVLLYYKKVDDSSFTDVDLTPATYSVTNETYIFEADTESSYQMYMEVTDYFTSSKTMIVTIPAAFVLMDFFRDGSGMSIGKVAEYGDLFDVALPTKIRNDLQIESTLPKLSLTDTENDAYVDIVLDGPLTLSSNNQLVFELPKGSFITFGRLSNQPSIDSYYVNDNSTQFVINPTGNLILGGGEYAKARYNLDLEGSTGENTYLGADGSVFVESNGNTIASRKTWQFNTAGDIIPLATSQGVYGVDSTGFAYPYARDNGTNLWIGSTATAAQHHKGQTFISSGHNGTTGNETIYVCVPNDANNNGTSYPVVHEGNLERIARYYEAQASSNSTSLPADTVTKITLAGLYSGGNPRNKYFEISGGGIKVKTAGRYRVSASAYISGAGSSNGVYVYCGTGTTLATSTEIMSTLISTTVTGGMSIAPKIVEANANDIFLLGARSIGAAGTCTKNLATYLLVEKLS